ncbi:hypothetical protein OU789_00655 [Halocynthiibacter sp. C4]|uniref:hypothetical protein n=1 Tax=Halocynthiibacter sp. C4 TaxID=2992758 RepID=UPI00237C16DE|nr:hypothetical protein [Halocynthiibacter sp. C4]MDE0588429.1 hypothetical protein [Halocynthiibacter sp. C4]
MTSTNSTHLCELSLHVGAHKTATTHLQQTFKKNNDLLLSAGAKFYGPKELRDDSIQFSERLGLKIPSSLSDGNRGGRSTGESERRKVQDSQKLNMPAMIGEYERVIISEENLIGPYVRPEKELSGRLYPRSDMWLREFAKCIPETPVNLYFSTRMIADHIASQYAQKLKAGVGISFRNYATKIDCFGPLWADVIERFSKIEGIEQIYVWRYEDYKDVHRKVMSLMAGSDELISRFDVISKRSNLGLSQRAVDEILSYTPEKDDGCSNRSAIAKSIRDDFPISDENPKFAPWSETELAASAEAYEEDIDRICELPKVTLITP